MNFKIIPYTLAASIFLSGSLISQPTLANQPQTTVKSIWQVFSSQEGGFSILFPGSPTVTKQKIKNKTGEIEVNLFTVERPQEDVKYTVAYIDYPEEYIELLKRNNQVEAAIDTGKKTAVENAKGTLISEEQMSLEGHFGKEVNYTKPGDKIVKQRIFLVDRRLYQVSAETTTKMQKYLTKSISGFCDSLKLLPK
ncbi:hypothetical protein IQ227_06480 [Anabaena aphanizomenioides LEGE 00250]|uniref:Uncharacterized protein n=1 Tax=Sphaerospermopsis aphanizomenoides LEGE 00250 TaxID=2777972 RepID=A0ABR9VB17_9CYAN|nr:hypothetical protein [Sphaerospermopsis aphanizomenoides]MBE9235691.1 hypothetical protein [Sphaerospermopsis aphanizomenoides LEGE 00250]